MRILIATPLYPPESGGPATYAALLERELSFRGFQVAVVKLSDVKKLPFGIRHLFFFFKLLRAGASVDIISDVERGKGKIFASTFPSRGANTRRSACIFAQDPLGVGLPALCAAKILGKKFMVKIVGDRAWEEYMNQESGIRNQKCDLLDEFQKKRYGIRIEMRRFIQKYVVRHADQIIVPSEYLKKLIVNGWGIATEKIEVIYNAFETPKVNVSRDEARKKLGISPEDEVVVSIGRLVPWKGFETLVDIFRGLLKTHHRAKLYIIGDGPEKNNLESRIKNYELSNNVFLTGNVSHEDALLYLAAADAMALNTGYEGLSHTIMEAMALGVPVITTRVGGNPELIEDGVSGRLVEYQDEEALSKAIGETLSDAALGHRRFEKPAQKKAAEFSKEKMLVHLTQIFKKICAY